MHHENINLAPRKFTAVYAEHVRQTVKPEKLRMINPLYARSDDGALEIGRAHGGGGFATNFRFIVGDRGQKLLVAGHQFCKNDNCLIVVGLKTFDAGLLFMKNRRNDDGEMIISTFSWFLLESFGEDYREDIGDINVHLPNSKVRLTFSDSF